MIAVRAPRPRVSWHLCNAVASPRTFCGRVIPDGSVVAATFPGDEKTCERCAVIAAKRATPTDVVYP